MAPAVYEVIQRDSCHVYSYPVSWIPIPSERISLVIDCPQPLDFHRAQPTFLTPSRRPEEETTDDRHRHEKQKDSAKRRPNPFRNLVSQKVQRTLSHEQGQRDTAGHCRGDNLRSPSSNHGLG
jgi:hypothetical protein